MLWLFRQDSSARSSRARNIFHRQLRWWLSFRKHLAKDCGSRWWKQFLDSVALNQLMWTGMQTAVHIQSSKLLSSSRHEHWTQVSKRVWDLVEKWRSGLGHDKSSGFSPLQREARTEALSFLDDNSFLNVKGAAWAVNLLKVGELLLAQKWWLLGLHTVVCSTVACMFASGSSVIFDSTGVRRTCRQMSTDRFLLAGFSRFWFCDEACHFKHAALAFCLRSRSTSKWKKLIVPFRNWSGVHLCLSLASCFTTRERKLNIRQLNEKVLQNFPVHGVRWSTTQKRRFSPGFTLNTKLFPSCKARPRRWLSLYGVLLQIAGPNFPVQTRTLSNDDKWNSCFKSHWWQMQKCCKYQFHLTNNFFALRLLSISAKCSSFQTHLCSSFQVFPKPEFSRIRCA